MSMTPGEWVYYPESGQDCAAIVATGQFVCEFIEPPSEDDARAIAALPDLVEVLKQMIACHGEETCPAIDVARAALNKAGVAHD